MRKDKGIIFELRKSGKSYREIQKITGISRSTLCEWFRNENWSKHIKINNNDKNTRLSIERLKKLNDGKKKSLDRKYKQFEEEAVGEFDIYKEKPLFIAGLMLYAGEGDRKTKGLIRLSNIDFYIHKIFINFSLNFLKINMDQFRFGLLLYPDLNIDACKLKWSEELNIPFSNFHKPQVIQGRHKTKRLHFGVGSTIINSSFLKRKLMVWVDLSKNYLS